jgi:hypothetical protein
VIDERSGDRLSLWDLFYALHMAIACLIATCVSFALCLAYLLALPFHPAGLAALLGLGTLVMISLGRRDDIVTTGITTAVVMVVAAMGLHRTPGVSRCYVSSIR